MTMIPAIRFPHGAPCHAPWNRPGPRPEKAWLCGQAWEAELAHEDLVLAHGPSVRERTLLLDVGGQGWLVALMPKSAVAQGVAR